MWKGLLFSAALFGVFILMALLNGQYFYKTSMVGFRIRASLINSIYQKAMRISNNAKKDTTVGEIVNLMAVDARNFFELIPYLHILWSGPMVIGLGLYFLYGILGPSVFAGIGVMVLMVPLTAVVATKLKNLQEAQMKVKDERVKIMNEVLNGMKVLKLYAWEPSFEESVLKVRGKEISLLKSAAVYDSVIYFVWSMAPFLVSLASFATFVLVDDNNVLTPQIAFVSLTLFNILGFPLAMFPMMITYAMQCWVSVNRINKFMNNEELDPNNVTHNQNGKLVQYLLKNLLNIQFQSMQSKSRMEILRGVVNTQL
jgi:ATP-binding cassette, subfamily C (CFTR/MRP), member 1